MEKSDRKPGRGLRGEDAFFRTLGTRCRRRAVYDYPARRPGGALGARPPRFFRRRAASGDRRHATARQPQSTGRFEREGFDCRGAKMTPSLIIDCSITMAWCFADEGTVETAGCRIVWSPRPPWFPRTGSWRWSTSLSWRRSEANRRRRCKQVPPNASRSGHSDRSRDFGSGVRPLATAVP